MGPVASQEAIKMLGTNGGGFFNANSAHPFENPTAADQLRADARHVHDPGRAVLRVRPHGGRHAPGLGVLAAMTAFFVVAVLVITPAEQAGNPQLATLGIDQAASAMQPAATWKARSCASASTPRRCSPPSPRRPPCGAVNGMHDSLTPLGGAVPLVLMQLGEVVFGGVGTGLYGMLIFAILAVFIAGLMIGRTPEYLGKKIEVRDMKMTSDRHPATPILVLAGTAIAVLADAGKAGIANPGAHGFSEILYALELGREQQRQRLRRPVGQHALLQRPARPGDVARPLRRDRAGAGHCRRAGGQEAPARHRRHACPRTARCSSCC
jgi:K+-transporting ATPase ATPase A chain